MTLTALDIFSGAGGLTLGLAKAGFRVLGAVDAWEPAAKTHRLNFSHRVLCGDVAQVSSGQLRDEFGFSDRVDLLAGGPPCQGFSIQRIGADRDLRNDLVFEFARLVLELRPPFFLMENVPGILGKRGLHIARQFQFQLEDGGYAVRNKLVNAADYGVPQRRKRVFFYGWLHEATSLFRFPPPTHAAQQYVTVWDAIGNLPLAAEKNISANVDPLHYQMRLTPKNQRRLRLIPPGGGFESLPAHMRVECHRVGADKIGHRYVYGRLAPSEPAGTLTGRFDSFTRGKFAHPFEHRNITLREGARLQTFPDDFKFYGNQEQIAALIGNAVPPLLAHAICRAIFSHLASSPSLGHELLERPAPNKFVAPQTELFSR